MTVKTKTHEENGDLGEAIRLANQYAHCFSFVGDKTMPEAQTALFGHLAKVIPQWQPIETAPRDGTEILTREEDNMEVDWWDNVEERWSLNFKPTHWMPLPPTPTTTEVSS